MPTITGLQIATDMVQALNIYMPGDTISSDDQTTILRQLNSMIGQWSSDTRTIAVETRLGPFNFINGKGGSANPYTIGPGGDFNVAKPPSQKSLVGCELQLNASSPAVQIPRGIMTNEAWRALRIKDLTSTLFTDIYYRPDYPLGSIFLWPQPTDFSNTMFLTVRQALTAFADMSTVYNVPDGYDEALYLNLALRCARFFGRKPDQSLRDDARMALGAIKRANTDLSDLSNDFAYIGTGDLRGRYNIQTGE